MKDEKKARHYLGLAAIGGSIVARHNLGVLYADARYDKRAIQQFIIGARAGFDHCLDAVRQGYQNGLLTKDGYAETLRAYQKQQDSAKSAMRDKARLYYANRPCHDAVRQGYQNGLLTKDEYTETIRAYQKQKDSAKNEG